MTTKYVLAISGNDIFSGGGLYADLSTYAANDLHGFVAVTCLTAMTENGFEVFGIDRTIFNHQLQSLKDVPFSAIKLGLLPDVEIAELALDFIKGHQEIPIVLDPVLVCKESHDVAVSALRDELLKFFPYVTIITPNLVEAELLAQTTIETLEDMKATARRLYELGARAVVVKGGNRFSQEKAVDVFYDGTTFEVLEYPVLESNNVGAGCTFASSIASQLVLGRETHQAVRLSKEFVYQAIKHSDHYGVKQHHDQS
ncbi:bifunctional hydroxymethylpyrimidine kinase/phosphomethylpyrimidine kinase [Streptococcus ovuberis]|uniref:pyridoxal kinase n=1 Tax=Streptococcus ovuberis TaxID=1936207 RepID=A0A7X6S1Y2_9STRE|nr:bifunctional hydroxymethylpyrimidine kinase/phosphomethylpyrimidine kinase [Streptococcus ovuberis]NKZ20840.1 bifunctional hydroxymethylpyrimidine kinase/phosphomethylpyrimidine kinase [Streptococcus ovuberis]